MEFIANARPILGKKDQKMKTLFYLILCFALVACSSVLPQPTPTPDYSTLLVTLERTPCFGTCPAYKLAIYGDGRVEYEGLNFVLVTGKQTTTISSDQVKELVAEFEKADFFALEENYSVLATDLPSTITTIALEGRNKKIEHYGECGYADINTAPQALCDVEQKIDAVVNSTQWTGK